MYLIDTRLYDDCFLLSEILEKVDLDKKETEALFKHFEKPKNGKWVTAFIDDVEYKRCTECGTYIESTFFGNDYDVKFCPVCGADMREKWKKIYKGTIAEGYCCPYCGKYGYEWEDHCEYCGKEVLPVKEKNGRKNFYQ